MVGALIGEGLKIGASIYGAVKSSQANKRAEELLLNQRNKNERWYQTRMAQDYVQRADAQNVLRKQRELLDEQYRRAKATALISGGTDESVALQQQAANQSLSDTAAGIAAHGAAYKEGVENQYMQNDAAMNQQQIVNEQNQANAIATAAGQVGTAASGLTSGLLDGTGIKDESKVTQKKA